MAVSKRLRFEILRRDNHTCRYCGGVAPDVILTVDHVVAVTLGGSDDPSNLVAACRDCNSGKSATPADAALVADVDQDAIRWAQAMHRATELAQIDRTARYAMAEAVQDYWDTVMAKWAYKPDDWERSVNGFHTAGLTADDMIEAVSIAGNKYGIANSDRWRYFCGVCNGMIRQRQDAARALIDAVQPEATKIGHCPGPWCPTHTTDEDARLCPECEQPGCEWACGYYEGRYHQLREDKVEFPKLISPTSRHALDVTGHLSRLVDGRMLAELGVD